MLAGLVKSPRGSAQPQSERAPSAAPGGARRHAELGFITETMANPRWRRPAHAVKPAGAGSVN